jgi:hypothetical protein
MNRLIVLGAVFMTAVSILTLGCWDLSAKRRRTDPDRLKAKSDTARLLLGKVTLKVLSHLAQFLADHIF